MKKKNIHQKFIDFFIIIIFCIFQEYKEMGCSIIHFWAALTLTPEKS